MRLSLLFDSSAVEDSYISTRLRSKILTCSFWNCCNTECP
jgi:hypothetical protein